MKCLPLGHLTYIWNLETRAGVNVLPDTGTRVIFVVITEEETLRGVEAVPRQHCLSLSLAKTVGEENHHLPHQRAGEHEGENPEVENNDNAPPPEHHKLLLVERAESQLPEHVWATPCFFATSNLFSSPFDFFLVSL